MQAISTTLPQAAADADILLERQVESYWDHRSEEFSTKRRRELDGPDGAAWRRLLTQYIDGIWPDMHHLRVLDVGTGAGFFAILLAEMGARVTGIDMSREMLHEAKENSLAYGVSSLTEFRPMNAQELDFDDASFDIVISRNLTWTLPDAAQAYREWSRVLKAGGLLLNFDSDYSQTVWTQDNTGDELADALQPVERQAERVATHEEHTLEPCAVAPDEADVALRYGLSVVSREVKPSFPVVPSDHLFKPRLIYRNLAVLKPLYLVLVYIYAPDVVAHLRKTGS